MSIKLGLLASSQQQAVPLLLDLYPNAAAAYSLRKLRTAYTGAAIRVRRSSDNTQTDIGFSGNGGLDTTLLSTFCGLGNGFVTNWYDQSGNSKNATQTTTSLQPYIYFSGSVITRNGKPSLQNSGYNYLTASTASGSGAGILYNWSFSAYNNDSLNAANLLAYEVPNTGGIFTGGVFGTLLGFGAYGGSGFLSSTYEPVQTALTLASVKTNSTAQIWLNGALSISGTPAWQGSYMTLYGGTNNTGQGHNGGMPEIIFYNTDQSSNKTGIESNINTFYTIY